MQGIEGIRRERGNTVGLRGVPVPWGYRGHPRTSQDRLSPAGSLHPEPRPQDSRFGSALGAVPNLSQDGLAGAVVGAPLEDEHRGALYVFHVAPGTLLPQYKQVRRRWESWEALGGSPLR